MNYDLLLKISTPQLLAKFLHECVNEMVGKKTASFDNYSGDIEWTKDEFNAAKLVIQNWFRSVVARGDEPAIFESTDFVDLPATIRDELRNCRRIRREEILQFVNRENLLENGTQIVENIDWKVKWINGTSKLATISEPIVQVDLRCLQRQQTASESNMRIVNFEMGLEQLDKFIGHLENVKGDLHAS